MHAGVVTDAAPAPAAEAAGLLDLAPCADCRRELQDPRSRRHRYPFIACTRCGPRYSAPLAEPPPAMCPDCRRECDDPTSRRFRLADNSCPRCGPQVRLTDPAETVLAERDSAIYVASQLLRGGRLVAVKGAGGYQLFADARRDDAVAALRQRLCPEHGELTVLCGDLAAVRACATVSPAMARLLQSPAAPVVLVPRRIDAPLAPSVTAAQPWLRVELPNTPLQLLLVQSVGVPLVVATASRRGEPACITAAEAHSRLAGIADAFLEHDRPIVHPVDDSILRPASRGPILLRRARGYAPGGWSLPAQIEGRLLCAGSDLDNAVAIASGDRVVLGPHVGDLRHPAAVAALERAIEALRDAAPSAGRFTAVAYDDASEGVAARFALTLGVPCTPVNHHLAHVLSCLLGHHHASGEVLGVAWDGGHPGPDGTVWGGEFLLVKGQTARRVARLRPFRVPECEPPVRTPQCVLLGLLHAMGDGHFARYAHSFGLHASEAAVLHDRFARAARGPASSSAGMLFAAASVLLQLSTQGSEGCMTPSALEAAAANARGAHVSLPLPLHESERLAELDWQPLFDAMLAHLARGRDTQSLAAAFHRALANGIVEVARRTNVQTVALSGGCFLNALLLDATTEALEAAGYEVLCHRDIPAGNNGLAAGQALGVARRLTSVARR